MFLWHAFDVRTVLPSGWAAQLVEFASANATPKVLTPTSVTSRESPGVASLAALTVGGRRVSEDLPWLFELYSGLFRDLGQRCIAEPLSLASDVRYAVNLNVQRGTEMRYEAHVDSNPLEGLLYVTSHPEGDGGELVVGNEPGTTGVDAIEKDCTRIYPVSGQLVFFDARNHAHYVAPLRHTTDIRVVVAMNFYTPSCPESARPSDLNRHLGIE